MEIDLKQRLIGAIVLTLIAAIFIPLLLSDEPVTHVTSEQDEQVPNEDYKSSLVPVTEINEVIEQAETEVTETITEVDTIEQPLVAVETPTQSVEQKPSEPEIKPSSTSKPQVIEEMQSVESVSITTKATEPTKKKQPKPTEPKGWLVQLGSFESEENAKKLNQKLLDKQFKSFIDPLKNTDTDKTAYRVRVGPPQVDKAKADALKKNLKELLKIEGIVIEYP